MLICDKKNRTRQSSPFKWDRGGYSTSWSSKPPPQEFCWKGIVLCQINEITCSDKTNIDKIEKIESLGEIVVSGRFIYDIIKTLKGE